MQLEQDELRSSVSKLCDYMIANDRDSLLQHCLEFLNAREGQRGNDELSRVISFKVEQRAKNNQWFDEKKRVIVVKNAKDWQKLLKPVSKYLCVELQVQSMENKFETVWILHPRSKYICTVNCEKGKALIGLPQLRTTIKSEPSDDDDDDDKAFDFESGFMPDKGASECLRGRRRRRRSRVKT